MLDIVYVFFQINFIRSKSSVDLLRYNKRNTISFLWIILLCISLIGSNLGIILFFSERNCLEMVARMFPTKCSKLSIGMYKISNKINCIGSYFIHIFKFDNTFWGIVLIQKKTMFLSFFIIYVNLIFRYINRTLSGALCEL